MPATVPRRNRIIHVFPADNLFFFRSFFPFDGSPEPADARGFNLQDIVYAENPPLLRGFLFGSVLYFRTWTSSIMR